MLILYGTQGGSAEEVAERIGRDAKHRNFSRVEICNVEQYAVEKLPNETLVVFAVATYGDGDPPDVMRQFWRFLLRKDLPKESLSKMQFAVFGLGDSTYVKYNYMARKLRNRLIQLGATEIVDRGFGDDQSTHGLEGDLDKWLSEVFWPQMLAKYPLPPGFVIDDSPELITPRYAAVNVVQKENQITKFDNYYKKPLNCYDTPVVVGAIKTNRRITADDWEDQDVRHLEIECPPSTLPPYLAGDICVLYPTNQISDNVMTNVLHKVLQLDPSVTLDDHGLENVFGESFISFRDLFTKYLDVLGTPRRRFFEGLSFFTENEEDKEKLVELTTAEGNDLYHSYCKKERKTYLEVFDDFQSVHPKLNYLLDLIPPLHPREYSISSSRRAHGEDMVHLTIAILKYVTPWGRKKVGVASAWVETQLQPGTKVHLYIKKGTLRPPEDPNVPLVLVGPGTGVAPMRSIIYERSNGKSHLYFGCRKELKDYYYKEEWEQLVEQGQLGSIRAAFSRDQDRKIYVQNLIRKDQEKICTLLLKENGYFFISGSANKMPNDVKQSVIKSLATVMESEQDAEKYVKIMEAKGRFKIEAWS